MNPGLEDDRAIPNERLRRKRHVLGPATLSVVEEILAQEARPVR
jgi:hypothetical protein